MDAEYFFDELYSQYCVPFPCYALLRPVGMEFVTESANDGTEAVVVLTDDDLLRRYRNRRATGPTLPVALATPDDLSVFVAGLPAEVTHVTFDPAKKFHRRYPIDVLRTSLAKTA